VDASYVILALPLLGALILFARGNRIGNPLAGWLATGASAGAFVATVVVWLSLLGKNPDARVVHKQIFTWIPVGVLHVNAALQLDQLSITMALFVTGVGSLIHLYSIGYMAHDREFPKFFFLLNLFLTSMLVLVLADNYLFAFVGWEGVGFSSYALVGFWFERNSAAVAAKKAFITNRVGDIGFMIALFLMFDHFHSFDYSKVLTPLMAGTPGAIAGVTATGLGIMLFLGAIGKSAQIPLYMWLPDAMEGPTPVSALIHAATMVTAGVYLMARSAPILHYTHSTQLLIACIGAATALFAATIACAQDDIKRVLAYSTISQLGYMFLAEGAGGYSAGLFHMITHAFFKALLFLSAGSVIHAMADEQNMKKMGNLRRYLPITYPCFMIGYLALSGIFPLAGFWSKDDVLDFAWQYNKALWAVGAVTAVLTAYYMTRQVRLVFYGDARWSSAQESATGETAHGEAAHGEAGGTPHESPRVMWIPLVILAFASFFGGLVNLPFGSLNFLERWLEPVFPATIAPALNVSDGTQAILSIVVLAGCLAGIAVGARAWRTADRPDLEPAVLSHGWYIDDAVSLTVSGPLAEGATDLAYKVDAGVIDGAVNGVAHLTSRSGRVLRYFQTGYVRSYAIGLALGTAILLTYVAARVGS
jgi:NADH-quinone oxidoreductase subunit L